MAKGNLIGRLKEREAKERADAEAAYARLVAATADNASFDEDLAESVLESVGKTPAELEQDVRRLAERRDLRKQLALVAPLNAEAALLQQEFDRLQVEARESAARYRAELQALHGKIIDVTGRWDRAQRATSALIDGHPDSAAKTRWRELLRRHGELHEQKFALEWDLRPERLERTLAQLNDDIRLGLRDNPSPAERARLLRMREGLPGSYVDPRQAKLAAIERQLEPLEAELAAIETLLIEGN